MSTKQLAPCKNCKEDFTLDSLIWADGGGMRWVCLDCYAKEGAL